MSIRLKLLLGVLVTFYSNLEVKAQIVIPCDSTREYYSPCGVIFTDSFQTDDINIPSVHKRYTPSIPEVLQAERVLFSRYKETLNKDSRVLGSRKGDDVKKIFWGYGRQYLGFLDSNDHKIVVIHLLNFEISQQDKSRYYKNFTKTLIFGGGYFFELNMSTLLADINVNSLKLY